MQFDLLALTYQNNLQTTSKNNNSLCKSFYNITQKIEL